MASNTAATKTGIWMRTQPDASNNETKIRIIDEGQIVELLGNDGKWLLIRYHSKTGYVNGVNLHALDEHNQTTIWTTTANIDLHIRSTPSAAANDNIVASVAKAAPLNVVGFEAAGENVWLKVLHAAGPGYVNSKNTRGIVQDLIQSDTTPQALSELFSKAQLNVAEISLARAAIEAIADPTARGDFYEVLQTKVLYRNQRDNVVTENGRTVEDRRGQMCNLTSLAMCLDLLGLAKDRPDMQLEDHLEMVRQEHGLPERINIQGWGGVARLKDAKVTLLKKDGKDLNIKANHAWYESTVRPALRKGNAVMMSICGHIIRVQAVTANGLMVDDPYGRCRLLPNDGGKDAKWHFSQVNEYQKSGQRVGEDVEWLWADVATHTMRWIAEISRAVGSLEPVTSLPNYVDNGKCL